jgi:hypothetical protein
MIAIGANGWMAVYIITMTILGTVTSVGTVIMTGLMLYRLRSDGSHEVTENTDPLCDLSASVRDAGPRDALHRF